MLCSFLVHSKVNQLLYVYVCIYMRRQWHPTPVLLPGKSHGQRSLVGCSPWGRWGSDTTERLHSHFSLPCIGEGNGNPLQCSCLENPGDGGAWWAAVYGVAQSRTWLKWLSSSGSSVYVYIYIFFFKHYFVDSFPVCVCVCVCLIASVVSVFFFFFVTLWSIASQAICPWDSAGKNTGVGCHASSRGSSEPRDRTHVSYISCFTTSATWGYHTGL